MKTYKLRFEKLYKNTIQVYSVKIVNLPEKYWTAIVEDEGRDNPNIPYYYHRNTARHNENNYGVHDRSLKHIRQLLYAAQNKPNKQLS